MSYSPDGAYASEYLLVLYPWLAHRGKFIVNNWIHFFVEYSQRPAKLPGSHAERIIWKRKNYDRSTDNSNDGINPLSLIICSLPVAGVVKWWHMRAIY